MENTPSAGYDSRQGFKIFRLGKCLTDQGGGRGLSLGLLKVEAKETFENEKTAVGYC